MQGWCSHHLLLDTTKISIWPKVVSPCPLNQYRIIPPVIVVINLMSDPVVNPKRLLIAESIGCLDAAHKIVPPCLSPLKVVQSNPLANYINPIVRLLNTHHLERQAINWCLKHTTMIHILAFKIRINPSTRHTFGSILFLLDQWCYIHTLLFQLNNLSWHTEYTIHHYCFTSTIQHLTHLQHHPNCSTNLAVLFLLKLFRSVLSFDDQNLE